MADAKAPECPCECPGSGGDPRGRAWHPRPRFAALIDLRHGRATAVAAAIVTLGQACGADLDLLCLPGAAAAPAGFGVAPERLHMLGDDAAEALPQFVAARGYDLIALTVSERGLAERLLEPAAHDLLFVKPAGRAVDPAAPDREGGQSPPAPMGSSAGLPGWPPVSRPTCTSFT